MLSVLWDLDTNFGLGDYVPRVKGFPGIFGRFQRGAVAFCDSFDRLEGFSLGFHINLGTTKSSVGKC